MTMKISRGGVEDTRLEVKTKETKKIQSQGQLFRGQTLLEASGGFRGGGWGGCIPPHQPKTNNFGRKIILHFGVHPLHQPKPNDFGRKISLNFGEDLVFCFFFWRPPDFGRKKRLNFRFRPKIHSQFR